MLETAFGKMLDLISSNGGSYQQGNNYDRILFKAENHREASEKVFNECKDLGLLVYDLSHNDGWKDAHNTVERHSMFCYR